MPKMVMEQGKVSRARPKALSSRMFLEPDRIHWKKCFGGYRCNGRLCFLNMYLLYGFVKD